MRSAYPHLNGPAPDPEWFVREATVVLDTSVLLGLYRLSSSAREEALGALSAVGSRLWIPYQVGEEFHRNLQSVRAELPNAYKKVRSELTRAQDSTRNAFGDEKRFMGSRELVEGLVNRTVEQLLTELETLRDGDAAIVRDDEDPVLESIDALLTGRVGPDPGPILTRQRVEDFNNYRGPNLIPPGFKDFSDSSKPTALAKAGDYLVWSQVIDYASVNPVPVLLVTNDVKDDWWGGTRGQRTGPRPELVKEFGEASSHGYYQLTFDGLLRLASRVGADVSSSTVDEAEDAAFRTAQEELQKRDRWLRESYIKTIRQHGDWPDSPAMASGVESQFGADRRYLRSALAVLKETGSRPDAAEWRSLASNVPAVSLSEFESEVIESDLWDDMGPLDRRQLEAAVAQIRETGRREPTPRER